MAKTVVIEIGKEKWNATALQSISEEKAVRVLGKSYKADQIRNAWKQANKKK